MEQVQSNSLRVSKPSFVSMLRLINPFSTDNPPPKVVQGYKFNIFYPDLIDKSKAPTYKLIKQGPNEDTILLLFTAGPPYEDIAFQIVNRDWEHSHKRYINSQRGRCDF